MNDLFDKFVFSSGAVVFMYSALEIAMRQIRADDELNGLAAGALTGAIYRSPHGVKASGIGQFFFAQK